MGHKENKLINQTWQEDNKKGRMFRANAGKAWVGTNIKYLKLGYNEKSFIKSLINKLINFLSKIN